MAFLVSKEQIRAIEWGNSTLWDIRFPDAPAPFDKWFPAQDIDETVFTLETHSLSAYLSTYEIPQSTALFNLMITFADDIYNTILYWITDWVKHHILNDGNLITPIADACRMVQIVKLNPQRQVIHEASYWVYPKGVGNFNGNNQASLPTRTCQFVIAGTVSNAPVIAG